MDRKKIDRYSNTLSVLSIKEKVWVKVLNNGNIYGLADRWTEKYVIDKIRQQNLNNK